ncbi:MFS transporter [Variovorax paradoxus]|jgi:MHS family proline/betaine transporter-like MFS transporter|uniref:MFS transporter n=1 Tax=Variovorax paradoxus TaxID=34073 RepID=UPI0003FECAA0
MQHVALPVAIPQAEKTSTLKRAITAGVIGHFVEWYDYGVYAYVATYLALAFFNGSSLMPVFATFAVAFFARPFGGLIFGYIGDRIGRQRCLAAVVVLMSLSTFIIGILPTFERVGALAPVLLLLCRILQGLSAGGEIAGASSFVNEYAPEGKRGLLSSLLPAASAVGLLLGSVLMLYLSSNYSKEFMSSWGWRIPFFIALPLGIVGLYLRTKVEDTPLFRELLAKKGADPSPLKSSLTKQFKWIVVAFGATLSYGVGFYMVLSYMPSYLKTVVGFKPDQVFSVTAVILIAHIIALPIWGAVSDRVGRRPVIIVASLLLIGLTYPAFRLIAESGSFGMAMFSGAILSAIIAACAAPLFAYMAEMFPTSVRASSISIGYNASVMLFGGTAPYIATYLIESTGNPLSPSFYLMAAAAGAAITLFLAPSARAGHLSALRRD